MHRDEPRVLGGMETAVFAWERNEQQACAGRGWWRMRWLAIAACAVVVGGTTGCDTITNVGGTRPSTPVPAPGGGGSGNAAAIIARHCVWCHTTAHPAAGIDLERMQLGSTEYDAMGKGVQLEMAPFIGRLSATDKRTLLAWIASQGGHVPTAVIPARATWRLADAIAAIPDGAPAPGFAFVVEDGTIDPQAWTVGTWTDRHGRTARGVRLDQNHSVDQSIFSSSRNPSSYLVFPGIAWHGRFTDSRMEGDVRVGRWMSIGMHARELQPTGRSHRQYVRLQIDRDAISLRSAPTPLETWPWGNQPDPRLAGNTDASGFYLTSGEWLHFVFEARRESSGVRWTARVTNPATQATIADLSALESNPDPLEGTFFLHAYSTGGDRMWANLDFSASIDPND